VARKLRKGRDRCTARRSDGQPCQATAIKGGLVCLAHGGSAPQVQLPARRVVLMERVHDACLAWEAVREVRGPDHPPGQICSRREADALGRIAIAERELEAHEADMELIRVLRAALRQHRRGGLDPGVRADLLELARGRLSMTGR
jgi:hypothetical protein